VYLIINFNKLYFSAPAPKQPKIVSMNEMRSELSLKRLNNADNEDISMSESGEKMISQSAIKKQRPNNILINENNSESGDNNNKGINSNNLVKVKHVGKNENSNDDDDDDEFDEMDEEDEEDEDLDDDIVLDEDDEDVEEEYDDEEGLDEDEDEEEEDEEEDEDDDDGLGGEDEENDDNNEISGVKPLEKSLEDTSTSKVEFNKPEISQHIQVIE
jgi:hypothetical protein